MAKFAEIEIDWNSRGPPWAESDLPQKGPHIVDSRDHGGLRSLAPGRLAKLKGKVVKVSGLRSRKERGRLW